MLVHKKSGVRVVTHWWSRVACLVHQGRRTQNCWSWRSRGECSHHYLPHRGWYLNERRRNIHTCPQTVLCSIRSFVLFGQVIMRRFASAELPSISNVTQINYQRLNTLSTYINLGKTLKQIHHV